MTPSVGISTLLSTVVVIATIANGAILSSPEPQVDPMVPYPALYVVSAGSGSVRGPMLTDGVKICPKHYPKGFSILCDAPRDVKSARFFTGSALVKVEYHHPFYIRGDYKMRVNPWTTYESKTVLGCKLDGGMSVSAVVSFTC